MTSTTVILFASGSLAFLVWAACGLLYLQTGSKPSLTLSLTSGVMSIIFFLSTHVGQDQNALYLVDIETESEKVYPQKKIPSSSPKSVTLTDLDEKMNKVLALSQTIGDHDTRISQNADDITNIKAHLGLD